MPLSSSVPLEDYVPPDNLVTSPPPALAAPLGTHEPPRNVENGDVPFHAFAPPDTSPVETRLLGEPLLRPALPLPHWAVRAVSPTGTPEAPFLLAVPSRRRPLRDFACLRRISAI